MAGTVGPDDHRHQTAWALHLAPVAADGTTEASEDSPLRSKIEIVQIRAAEVQAGDVVNKRGPNRDGWIEVLKLEELENGSFVVHDETGRDSFTAVGYDLVWLQVARELRHNSHMPMPD